MDELVSQIASKYGIPPAQATEIVKLVFGFVKEKVPAIGGQLDTLAGAGGAAPAAAETIKHVMG